VLDEDIYNFDKTGCQIGITTGEIVIVPADVVRVYVNDPDNKKLITVVKCISAGGYYVPAIVIFKRWTVLDEDIYNFDKTGCQIGITTGEILKYFDKFTKNRTKSRYRILIFDKYSSHITQEFIDYY
ncbi:hypothetical protein BDZ45DRAFT_602131, partial [Acephala macrosclerotiorum]